MTQDDQAELEIRIGASRLRLRARSPFFATLALHARFQCSERTPTMATDGRTIFVNPDFAASLPNPDLDAVVMHEVLHCALMHMHRRGERDAMRWNIAADVVVNDIVESDLGYTLPEGAFRQPYLAHLPVEEIYELLEDHVIELPAGFADLQLGPPSTAGDDSTLAGEWRDAVRNAEREQRQAAAGKNPALIERFVDAALHTPLDWRSRLWRFLARTPTDFSEFDRRFVGRGLYLETTVTLDLDVLVCVDTSGSVTAPLLGRFLAEVRAIGLAYPGLSGTLYYADAALHGPYALSGAAQPPPPVGGGGTSFIPFFDHARGHARPQALLLYMTDGHGWFPEQAPTQDVLWVVSPGGLQSDAFPFGDVVRIQKADD